MLYISAHKKATAMVFFWGDSGYPPLRFEYKTASEGYLVTEILGKQFYQFHQFLNKKIENHYFSESTQECSAYISGTKYPSEVVLYLKWTGGYPLSPHKKTIAVAFLWAEI